MGKQMNSVTTKEFYESQEGKLTQGEHAGNPKRKEISKVRRLLDCPYITENRVHWKNEGGGTPAFILSRRELQEGPSQPSHVICAFSVMP